MSLQRKEVFALMLTMLFGIIALSPGFAQDNADGAATCPSIVEQAYAITDEQCSGIGLDQACYGNIFIEALPDQLIFDEEGDVIDLTDLEGLRLSEMDPAANEWGISLMRVRAVDPDGGPTQSVEMLLFGDVEITDDSSSDRASALGFGPLQAFTFSASADDAQCAEAPASGILIQTPAGVGEVALLINEVLVDIGSTAYLRLTESDDLSISVLEGQAVVEADGASVTVEVGNQTIVPLQNLRASGPPSQPQLYGDLGPVPVCLLSRPFILDVTSTLSEDTSDGIEVGQIASVDLVFPVRDTPCPRTNTPSDIVLVIDVSGSMRGSRIAQARAAASRFLTQLDNTVDQVALVRFDSEASVVNNLTDDFDAIQNRIASLLADGGTDIADGLNTANGLLRGSARPNATPVIVLLSDGQSDFEDAVQAANTIVDGGGQIISVGIGAFDENLMRAVASSDDAFLETDTAIFLRELFEQTALDIGGERPVACDITFTYTVDDDNFELVEDLALGGQVDGSSVTWKIGAAFEGQVLTRSLGVRALEAGTNPVGVLEVTYNPCDEPSLTSAGAFEGPDLSVVGAGEADPGDLIDEGILTAGASATGMLEPFGFGRWLYSPETDGIYSVIVEGSGDTLPVLLEGVTGTDVGAVYSTEADDGLSTVLRFDEASSAWLYVQSASFEDVGAYDIRIERGFVGDEQAVAPGDSVRGSGVGGETGDVYLLEGDEIGDWLEVIYEVDDEAGIFPVMYMVDEAGEIVSWVAAVSDTRELQAVRIFNTAGDGQYRLFVAPNADATYQMDIARSNRILVDQGALTFDQPINAELQPGLIGPGSVHVYTFETEANEAIQLNWSQPSFRTVDIEIRDPNDGTYIGGGFSSDAGRTSIGPVVVEEAGTYNLVLTNYSDASSDYTLTVERVDVPEAVRAPIEVGTPVEGALFGSRADEYLFDGVAGDLAIITMEGANRDVDPVLTLLDPDGEEIAFNDDADGLDARIGPLPLPTDGEYTIVARSFSSSSSGEYTLRLNLFDPDDGIPVSVGSNVNLRSGPGTNFGIVGGVSSGDTLIAIGRNEAGDWLRALTTEGQAVWIFASLVQTGTAGDVLDSLPVVNADGSLVDAGPIDEAADEPAATATPAGDCTVTALGNANRRSGAGTGFAVVDVLAANTSEAVVAQTTGPEGFTWWELPDGTFVREDTVSEAGDCAAVPQR